MENTKKSIYFKRDNEFYTQSERLKKSNLSQRNKDIITRWQNYLFSKGVGKYRIAKCTMQLRLFCEQLNKDFETATKEDLEPIIALYSKSDIISDATRADYMRILKQFYGWFKTEDKRLEDFMPDLPREQYVQLLKAKQDAKKLYQYLTTLKATFKLIEIDPSEVITDDDIAQVLEQGCKTSKEMAFISALHESGCRIGEFLGIKLKDIVEKPDKIEVSVTGKTGRRTVYFYTSQRYILEYKRLHLDKNNPESPLWLSEDARRRGQPLAYIGARLLLKRCYERAGLKKKTNLHWMRHSRASILAGKVTEPILRKVMGWSKDSRMLKHYSHISDNQVVSALNQYNGVETLKEKPTTIKCNTCLSVNSATEKYCFKCLRPLRVETILQDQENLKSTVAKLFEDYLATKQDPSKLKQFQEWQAKQKV